MQLRNHITDNTALFKIIKQKLNHDDRKPTIGRDFLFLIAKIQSCADGYGFVSRFFEHKKHPIANKCNGAFYLELIPGFEPGTSSLPRMCSAD